MTERAEVRWGLTPIPFAVHRSARRKTVALTMHDGHLVVTAPEGVPLGRLKDVVRQKARWVVERQRRAAEAEPPVPEREFVTGETVLYRGRQLRLKVLEATGAARSRIRAGWYEVGVAPGLSGEALRRAVRHALVRSLKERAERHIPARLAALCAGRGVCTPEVRVRDPRRRWGSCDAAGVLRINWRIVQAPTSLMDYVLVHEWAHVEHRAHGPAFWAAVARWLPDYDDRRRRLRELGPRLVW